MKTKVFLLLLTFAFISSPTNAQRGTQIGFVDMEYILENVPEYQQASQQLDAKIQQWKKEIELKRDSIETMKAQLENERPLLTQELIEERKAEIKFAEKQLLEYQQKRFGPTGDMIVQKRQLIKPVQDQVFNAVQQIGVTRKYDFIFEKSPDALMLYSANRHDLSDQVLNMIVRSSRQNATKEPKVVDPYKSVKQAEKDKKEEAERQAVIDKREQERQALINKRKRERQAMMEARQKRQDSIRAVREAAYQARREKLMEQRAEQKRKRDSLIQLREEKRNQANEGE